MNACNRFEQEGLLAVEAGRPLDPHFDDCPDCLAARAEIHRLGAAIAVAAVDERPPGDWQARVWAEIRRGEGAKAPLWRRGWALATAGLAAAIAVAVLLTPRAAPAPELVARVEPGEGPVRRGSEARPGDRLVLEASTGGLANAELRVYLNDRELVLRCSGEEPCARRGGTLTAVLPLPAIGTYQPVLLASDGPLPEPGAGLDADTAAAMRSGARVEMPAAVVAR